MNQPKRIVPEPLVWLRIVRARMYRLLRMQLWFPHAPLALVVGGTGLAQLLLTSGSLSRLIAFAGAHRTVISSVAGSLGLPMIRGAPQEAIGGLQFLVGIGLLWRSRLAWMLAFLLTLATVSLQLSPVSTASTSLIVADLLLLVLLLVFRTSFTRVSLATGTLFALTGVLVTIGYGVLGSYVMGQGFKPPITNIEDAVYFAIVTMSTVGYGDIVPLTQAARMFTVSLVVLGLVVFATSLTAIVGPVIDNRMMRLLQPKRRKMKRASHIIVIGNSPFARNAAKSLMSRGLQVTMICRVRHEQDTDLPEDVLVGDGSDTEVLRRANIEQARAVLALSSDDSYNAFVVLAAKELNPAVRTVVAVNDAANTGRVQRVHPDVVLALPEIGSELLAMALSGEEIRADAFINQLLKLG